MWCIKCSPDRHIATRPPACRALGPADASRAFHVDGPVVSFHATRVTRRIISATVVATILLPHLMESLCRTLRRDRATRTQRIEWTE